MKDYIKINGLVGKKDEKFTEEELDRFITEFLNWIESQGLYYAGSWKMKSDDEVVKEHEALDKSNLSKI